MKFEFDNLGPIEHGEVELGKLTVFCGRNNTGKTYVSYLIYGFYYYVKEMVDREIERSKGLYQICEDYTEVDLSVFCKSIPSISRKIEAGLVENLPIVFRTDEKKFEKCKVKISKKGANSSITVDCLKRSILDTVDCFEFMEVEERTENVLRVYVTKDYRKAVEELYTIFLLRITLIEQIYDLDLCFASVYMLPAERAGLNMFYKELNVNRNNLVFDMKKDIRLGDLTKRISKYSLPISEYINLLNEMSEKKETTIGEEFATTLEEKIVHGKFTIQNNGTIDFVLNGSKKIDFHLSSSTAKSLFGLDYILKNEIKKDCTLIIDEPEQNLHPDNQRFIARLLCQLVNAGVNVIISTHSDYIIKELNNLILLGNKFKGYEELMLKYGYEETELLSKEDVKGYVFLDNSVEPVEVNEQGMKMDIFDDVINSMNEASDDIYYTYCEGKENDHE